MTITIVTSMNLERFIGRFQKAEVFSFDFETPGLFPYDRKEYMRVLSIAFDQEAWVIPLEMPFSPFQGRPEARSLLMNLILDIAKGKRAVAQNGKFDNHWIYCHHGRRIFLNFDTMLASHVIDENAKHDLEVLSAKYLGAEAYDIPLAEKNGSKSWALYHKGKFEEVHQVNQRVYEYAGRDALYTVQLYPILDKLIRSDPTQSRLFYSLVMPGARAMDAIETRGLTLDLEEFAKVEIDTNIRLIAQLEILNSSVRRKVRSGVQKKLNWNSPKQIGELLYGDLGLPVLEKTPKGSPSTGEAAIYALKGMHPVVDALTEYRELEKFRSTYIDGWKPLIFEGRIYFSYKIHGTVTGRYSSRLHQIPRDGRIRNLVTAPPGWKFVQADVSQAELRVAAITSQDPEMVRCFTENIDIHWRTVLEVIKVLGGSGADLARETATLYCLQHELPPDGTSCEVLQEVWTCCEREEETDALLQKVWEVYSHSRTHNQEAVMSSMSEILPTFGNITAILRKVQKDKTKRLDDKISEDKAGEELRTRIRRKSSGSKEPLLEGGSQSYTSEKMEARLLRALWKYVELRCSSQGSKPGEQQEVQFAHAMPLLSSFPPSTAQKIKKDWKEVRKRLGKSTNFGYVYGMYPNKFIETAKLKYGFTPTYEEANEMRQAYFRLYRGLEPWHNRQKKLVKLDGFVRSLSGRLRRLPAIRDPNKWIRMEAERQAVNSPIQGFIGDYKAMALIEIEETLDKSMLQIVGEHHDAILMIVKEGCEDEILPKMHKIMKHPRLLDKFQVDLPIPMESDIEVGNWGAGKLYIHKSES